MLLDRDLDPSADYVVDNPSSHLADVTASLSISSARAHAFSISREEGAAALIGVRARGELSLADSLRGVHGTDRAYKEAVFVTRLFQPLHGIGLDGHVLAFRGSAGYAEGPGADRFHFDAGGAEGRLEQVTGFGLFGDDADDFPVRGYAVGERSGRYAWSATAEYRFPIKRVNRGIGLVPVHLEAIHADFFADAANAWGPGGNPRGATLASVGAELSFDFTLLFSSDFPLRFGFAAPRTGSPSLYLRLGPSF